MPGFGFRKEALAAANNSFHSSEHGLERCPGTERWGAWPSPVGLTLGLLAALCAQLVVIGYHYARLRWCRTRRVQAAPRPYEFAEGIASHLANPGGIIMMIVFHDS